MKTLVISDVHANIVALEAVWARESDADRVLCAGDVVDYGPWPGECIDWLATHRAETVAGNHDLEVLQECDSPGPEAMSWRADNARKLATRHIDWLRSLPAQLIVELDGMRYGMAHAYRDYDIIRSVEALHEFGESRFGERMQRMIFGHTHRRELHLLADDAWWLNPGSISYRRKDESFRGAHYAVITDGQVSLRAAPYPTARLHQAVLAAAVSDGHRETTLRWWPPG